MANWIAIGPAPQIAADGTKVSGRVDAIATSTNFNGSGRAAVFIGTSDGGVWRSTNFASEKPTWTPLTDNLALPITSKVGILRTSALTVDPRQPQVIYAAVGDSAIGILKSQDGGNSWTLLGQSIFFGGWPIGKILVDPTDPSGNTLYLSGGDAGIYTSSDGGETWFPRTNGLPATFRVSDLEYTVGIAQDLTLYAGVTYAAQGDDNGIWRSTDLGASWTRMDAKLIDLQSGQLLSGISIERITLAADHQPGFQNGIFAALSNVTTRRLLNVLALDAKAIWQPAGGDLPKKISTQGGANQPIGISTNGTIYLGTSIDGVFQSTNQGDNWIQVNSGTNGIRPHVDHHVLAFFDDALYNGNDGGIWRFNPLPNSVAGRGTWESLNTDGLQTHLVRGVSLNPTNMNVVLAGNQDNSIALRSPDGAWTSVNTGIGDGGPIRFDPDPNNGGRFAYTTSVSDPAFFFRSDDSGRSFGDKSVPGQNLNIPDDATFVFDMAGTSRLLVGLAAVYETSNQGDNWNAISPALDGSNRVVALASADGNNIVYVAYSKTVFKTTNHGGLNLDKQDWPRIDQGTNWGGDITAIVVDYLHSDIAYLTTNAGNVWRTRNGGLTWEEITGYLPKVPINTIVLHRGSPTSEPLLFLGTDVGVFASAKQASDTCWRRYGKGLPDVQVRDLDINSNTDTIVAGTYGRGVFVTSIEQVLDSLHVHIEVATTGCEVGFAEGAITRFRAVVSGIDDLSQVNYKWSVSGAQRSGPDDLPTLSARMPSATNPVSVAVVISDSDGCSTGDTLSFFPIPWERAIRLERLCRLAHELLVNLFIDPLGDPPRDLAIRPISPNDARKISYLAHSLEQVCNDLVKIQDNRKQ